MTDKQIIEVYKCAIFKRDLSFWCKYYPKGCNKCGCLVKVGEENNDR